MKIDQQESEAFTVIGLTLTTNNAKEMSGAGGIAALWQRVSEEKIADKGQMPDIVIKAWQYIWAKSSQLEINRSYTADFEVYDHRCANPLSSRVDLFIAVK